MVSKIYLHHNVCERRIVGYEKLKQYMQQNYMEITDNIEESEYILFFACGMKVDDTQESVAEYKRSGKRIIVFGCAPKMIKIEPFQELILIDLKDGNRLDEIFHVRVKYNSINIYECDPKIDGREYLYNQAMQSWDPRLITPKCRDIYSITISEGCSNNCSYCSIHNATGELRSRSVNEIVNEMKNAIDKGFRHFRLQCENSGSYGTDRGTNLGELLEAIQRIDEEFDIDLPDLHPEGFVKYFDCIVNYIKMKSVYLIHLPIQSGSQKILDAMERKYSIKQVEKCLEKLFEIFPNIKVGTDIIVGFPGETEEDFIESYNLIGRYNLSPLYVHGYCDKQGTVASGLKDKVEESIKIKRIERMFSTYNYAACYLNNYREADNI